MDNSKLTDFDKKFSANRDRMTSHRQKIEKEQEEAAMVQMAVSMAAEEIYDYIYDRRKEGNHVSYSDLVDIAIEKKRVGDKNDPMTTAWFILLTGVSDFSNLIQLYLD